MSIIELKKSILEHVKQSGQGDGFYVWTGYEWLKCATREAAFALTVKYTVFVKGDWITLY